MTRDEVIWEMFIQYIADMVEGEPPITLKEYKGYLGIDD